MLALGDVKNKTQDEIKEHLVVEWNCEQYSPHLNTEKLVSNDEYLKMLSDKEILIAYESVGDYGCDSSGTYVLSDDSGELYLITGSHCSCYGFEGQGNLEPIEAEALSRLNLSTGGYDNNDVENEKRFKEAVEKIYKDRKDLDDFMRMN